ncbi:hypothetical protein OOT00_01780 [Desulfobotulus sp. H1]|uniref:Uncharacterized protein n=1 Tax=Desulfobotulus pelophilus TaxID=2823377 RepID=A0ABT3N5H9_9BACT|nr:HD domain-containing phosphohydrolase [Desulfobotulus pelophilus]MCW7752713.1 hypothetical protein [Desulfobotulus pelophilus]
MLLFVTEKELRKQVVEIGVISSGEKKERWLQQELTGLKAELAAEQKEKRFFARHCRQLRSLLENALEQNRLLADERKSLWSHIEKLQVRRRSALEKMIGLLSFLQECHGGGEGLEDQLLLTEAVGDELRLSFKEKWRLRQAVRLHRIGLFHLPHEQQTKPEICFSVTVKETLVQVPVASAHMVAQLEGLSGVARVLRHLGERYDGSGGPSGLKGENIPTESRILSAVLAYGSLVAAGQDRERALVRLGQEALWDPAVLAALRMLASQDDSGGRTVRIRLSDLAPGMVLAAPLHARAGAMLLPEGISVTEIHLEKLRAYSGAGPLDEMVRVYRSEEE